VVLTLKFIAISSNRSVILESNMSQE